MRHLLVSTLTLIALREALVGECTLNLLRLVRHLMKTHSYCSRWWPGVPAGDPSLALRYAVGHCLGWYLMTDLVSIPPTCLLHHTSADHTRCREAFPVYMHALRNLKDPDARVDFFFPRGTSGYYWINSSTLKSLGSRCLYFFPRWTSAYNWIDTSTLKTLGSRCLYVFFS